MKLSRKLIPAFIMLLVSAVLMSTASFAWFSANSTASANNMVVSVSAARNLSIADITASPASPAYNSSFDFAGTTAAMTPGSTAATATPTFYYVSDSDGIQTGSSAAVKDKTEFAKVGTNAQTESGSVVYVKKVISLMATGAYESGNNHGDIEAHISVEGSTSVVDKSLRVMLVVKDNRTGDDKVEDQVFVYAPITGATNNYHPIVAEGAYSGAYNKDAEKNSEGEAVITLSTNSTPIIEDITSDQPWTIEIYYWFEGQDANCTAANAINIGLLNIDVAFTFAGTQGGNP